MKDPVKILSDRFVQAIVAAFGEAHAHTDPLVRPSQNPQFGDYQANVAMSLAKPLGKKPREVAEAIAAHLHWQDLADVAPTIAGPGFINITLSPSFISGVAGELAGDARLGVETAAAPRTVVVDYSGPNVAKEMHVGHLRSTVIGDALARVLEHLGDRVVRQNHMGDWGTQFGMLIEYLLEPGVDAKRDASINYLSTVDGTRQGIGIGDLNSFYQAAKKNFDADADFADRARRRVVALQGGDAATLKLWRYLVDESAKHFNDVYRRLNVTLTDADVRPESFYNDQLPGVVAELEQKGLTALSEGAVCVFMDEFKGEDGRPLPLIIRKSDGGYLYATTDLAAVRYRIEELKAMRIIYVTDARQKQHFAQVFKAAEKAGWTSYGASLEHVPFGTILGEDNKPFKTRSGDTVKLIDLLDEAQERAEKIVREKSPELPADDARRIASVVGIGAVKYADLANDRVKDYVFSWDRMLAMEGNTAPYLQYAYARIRSIFRKAGLDPASLSRSVAITHPAEKALLLKLVQFGGVVRGVADALEPHRLCVYLYELATAFSSFYEKCPVLTAPDEATKTTRLILCDITSRTLKQGLNLLGIETLERM